MRLLGHRGARHEAPENTLAGIELALGVGVGAIEIDVQPTRDGQLVVFHDDTLERTTDGTGRVDARDLAALRALDAGQGERIPTLDEVLAAVAGKAELFVELKAPGCEQRVVDAIRARGQLGECWVKSFQHPWLERVKALEPTLRTACLIYGRPSDPAGLVRSAGADGLSLGIGMLDAELVAACHAAGYAVCGWNLNDPAEVERYRAMDLDWLGSDVPSKLAPCFA